MFSYLLAAALVVTMPMVAECNCSPEKIEALKAKLRAEGASEEKVKDVNCDDVCEAEKPLATSSTKDTEDKEDATLACEDCTDEEKEKESAVLASCNCGGKRGRGNS